ncbi:uncharacterized protein IA-2 isoform X3 [Panulirus ornatus]|uniref:uncharacterized protein IA-2 isoform X3 n=1 Tax=Panulirus ornatus TaxID=150431 RepID=UPI003A83F3D5
MYRYVAVLFALLAVYDLRTLAAGNIGCLFSDTLCEQDREWCYDDQAFGHCLPRYGHFLDEDLHKYDLGSEDLRLLEREMQRLFLLGYRWSHTYTQCVLQTLLHSIRRKIEFDISSCNGDLDQDLEGALRAIEGEELEQVDPRDLAIVRFTPSATDPHSDYADEVYFPPIKDPLLDDHSGEQDDSDLDHQETETSESGEGVRAGVGSSSSSSGGGGDDHGTSPQRPQDNKPLPLPANPPGPPPNLSNPPPPPPPPAQHQPPLAAARALNFINYYGNNNGYDNDVEDDDEDVYQSSYHYQTPLNPVFRKRRMEPPRLQDIPQDIFDPQRLSLLQIKNLPELLDDLRKQEAGPMGRYKASEAVLFPERYLKEGEDEEEEEDEGVFAEEPTRPMYTEGGLQFIPELEDEKGLLDSLPREASDWSDVPEDPRVVLGGLQNSLEDLYNMPGVYENLRIPSTNFGRDREDMRNLPDSLRNMAWASRQYVPQEVYLPDTMGQENSIDRFLMQSEPPFASNVRDLPLDRLLLEESANQLPRSSPRLSALEEMSEPEMDSLREYEENFQDYDLRDDYGNYDQYDEVHLGEDQLLPLPQKFVKKDEESAGMDYGDLLPQAERNFQRPERVDVKKPGPFFNSENNFAFDNPQNGDEDRADEELDDEAGVDDNDILLSRLLAVGSAARHPGDGMLQVFQPRPLREKPDLFLAEEGLVDDVIDKAIPPDVLPLQQKQLVQEEEQEVEEEPKEKEEEVVEKTSSAPTPTTQQPEEGSFVYIVINGRFREWEQANSLAEMVVLSSGLKMDDIDRLSVDTDEVAFHVKPNGKGVTAADVAKKAEEMREYVKTQLDVDISQTGVGTKTTMSAVVFSSSEKHILAAAAIVCGVMAALLVAATVLFFLRRHARSKDKLQKITAHDTEASKDYQELCRERMAGKAGDGGKTEPPATHAPSQRVSSISKDSDNGNNSPSSRSSTSSCEEPVASNMDISTGHMVLSYMEDHLKNKDRLEQEWIALCAYEAEPCGTTLALKPENNQKNRYPDSVPYDHNRVVLNAHSNVNGSDYINASSITDHDPRNPAYIATQGPLESTAADFWQLVWEQGSVVIVMLTRLTENGHALCYRYWPEEGSELYHIYEVHLVSEHIWCDDYLVRSFYLKNVRTGETRTVTQFHFLSWPDSGTPASTKALLEFRRKVNKSYRGRSCPIIVHCSDGIGRTGTYCLIDMVLNRMAKGAKEIDIAATLEHIRDQRPHMVKSKAQFEFVLMAVAEEVHAILKALPQ